MSSSRTYRNVVLPDGTESVEEEHVFRGGSETQATYRYFTADGATEINVDHFKLDYWGRVTH